MRRVALGRVEGAYYYYITIIQYHTILYYTILYYTILYYTILYSTIFYYSAVVEVAVRAVRVGVASGRSYADTSS